MKKILNFTAAMAMAAMLSTSASATGLEDFFVENANFVPHELSVAVYQEFGYESNPEETSGRAKNDETFYSKTGVMLDLYKKYPEISYGFAGDFSYKAYTNEPRDTDTFEWDFTPHIVGSFGLTENDELRITTTFQNHREIFDQSDRTYVNHQTYGLSVSYDTLYRDRLGLYANTGYKYEYYAKHGYHDNDNGSMTYELAPYYKFSERIKSGLHLTLIETRYKDSDRHNDSKKTQINPFVNYQLTDRLSTHLEAGWEKTSYKGAAKDSQDDDDWEPDYHVSFAYQLSDRMSLSLGGSHYTEDSKGSRGLRQVYSTDLSHTWKLNDKFGLTHGVILKVLDEKNGNYSDDREWNYRVDFDYALNSHILLYTGYKFGLTDFRHEDPQNNLDDFSDHTVYIGARLNF